MLGLAFDSLADLAARQLTSRAVGAFVYGNALTAAGKLVTTCSLTELFCLAFVDLID